MVKINFDEIGLVVDRLIDEAKEYSLSNERDCVPTRDVKQAIRPIIERYSPLADRYQRVSREVRNAAYEHLNELAFDNQSYPPPFGLMGEYFFRNGSNNPHNL